MHYLFEYGRDPQLARLEIVSYLETYQIPHRIIDEGKKVCIIDLEQLPTHLIDALGGTIRIAEVLCNAQRIDELDYSLSRLTLYTGTHNKLTYYVTDYDSRHGTYLLDWLKDHFKSIRLKAMLKKDPTPTKLHNNKEALDFILFRTFVAKTVAVTNPRNLKERDIGRPNVDYMKVISIRLAKILVNLSRTRPGDTILDPFCGSGTILQEALLKGINAIGADQDAAAINQTQKNLAWLKKAYTIKATHTLHQTSATKLSTAIQPQSIDAVVTEPYLGPYLRHSLTIMEAKTITHDLIGLYTNVFRELARVLKKEKYVIFIVPLFTTRTGERVRIHLSAVIGNTPFTVLHSIPYQPPKAKIGREIIILQKH